MDTFGALQVLKHHKFINIGALNMWQQKSRAANRFMRRQVEINSEVTEKDLQQDLVATGPDVWACPVRHMRFLCQNSKTPLLDQMYQKGWLHYCMCTIQINNPQQFVDSVLWNSVRLFRHMNPKCVWRKKNKASEQNLLPTAGWWLSDALGLLCLLWRWKPAARGRQAGFV